MKTFSTLLVLALIVITCIVSAALYLEAQYNTSAILCLVWISSITLWIKSNGLFASEERVNK